MKAIIAHPNLDFDALASMAAAQKLYPDAVLVTVGKLRSGVRDYLAIHGSFLEIRNYIDKKEIDTLIMVDTRSEKRLQEFREVLDNDDLRVIVYDHHENADDDIEGAQIHFESLGANVTQLVERIRERGIEISPREATTYALGIYDDTGSLRFASTTVRDVEAVAYLLSKGANLGVISEYSATSLSAEQNELFTLLLRQNRIRRAEGAEILFAWAERDRFITDLATLTMKLKETFSVDAVLVAVRMERRVYIVGRSGLHELDLREVLADYGGKGHQMAASAMLKDVSVPVKSLIADLEKAAFAHIRPALKVKDIMTSPVKTIDDSITVNEVGEYLVRYGHSGFPVMRDGKLCGIITHRDIEKCKYHGLGNVPVRGYMSSHPVTVGENTSVSEARRIMVDKNIGRLPVLDDGGNLVGIVTRSNMLEPVYGAEAKGAHRLTYTFNNGEDVISLREELKKVLPDMMYSALRRIALLADELSVPAYLVGGLVRDLLLGKRNIDLDIVVEGDGIAFAEKVTALLEGTLTSYPKFGTATVSVDGVVKIDIAGARTEFYEYPAAKPQTEKSSLRQDLFRRDFTVNAMAVSLNRETPAQLIDYFNGRKDLAEKKLRVLHNLSFVEDPTRILRGLRFAARYDFSFAEETETFARNAVKDGIVSRLSRRRLWHEMHLCLKENRAFRILSDLNDYGIWSLLFPDHPFDPALEEEFDCIEKFRDEFGKLKRKPDLSLVRALLIFFPFGDAEREAFFEDVCFSHYGRKAASLLEDVILSCDGDAEETTEYSRYRAMREDPVETIIAAFIKAEPPLRKKITEKFRFYQDHPLLVEKREIREMPGYERGMMNDIFEELLRAKCRGEAETKEDELALIADFLEAKALKE